MPPFVYACLALLAVASGPTLVSPLYPLYQTQYGLSNGVIGLVASVYAVSLIPAMLLAGPLSDRWGRPGLLVPGLGLFVLSDLAFAFASSVHWLVAGRLFQGLAMGAFFSPSAALASDLAGKTRAEAAALGVGVASMVGFGIGPWVAGLLVQADISPTSTPFMFHVLAVVLAGVLLAFALRSRALEESRNDTAAPENLDHPVARRLAILTGFGGWAVGGLLFVMFAAILRPLAPENWPLLSGTGLLGLMSAGAAAQVMTRRWPSAVTLAFGALIQSAGLATLLLGFATGWISLMLSAVLITGLGLASVHRGGIGLSIKATPAARKGWAISLFLACAYFASNFPVIGFGVMADRLGMLAALIGYAAPFGLLLTGSGCYALLKRKALP